MEFINKIELQGTVGNLSINTISGKTMAKFSLLIEQEFTSSEGSVVINSTWFSCTAWQGEKIKSLINLKKGAHVHLIGKVKMQSYVDSAGVTRHVWEVVCQELEIVK